ncbi:MAG TPA: ABC transporter permease, partial [Mycobacteriales bacterium]|nr:ABC transporter permease [Mycobacteriales bacterium]
MAVRDRVARGESPADAEAAARREFGNLAMVAETTRDSWGVRWLMRLAQDLRSALRALRHAPTFAAITVLTLALGIGAATTINSVTDALVLHRLPFPSSDRLVYAHVYSARYCPRCYELPLAYLAPLREGTQPGIDFVASRSWSPVLRGAQRTRVLPGAIVSPDFFQVLGAQPELGRLFAPADTAANAGGIVLSDAAWRGEFAADPRILGRYLVLDGVQHPVIGVLRSGDVFPPRVSVWQAMTFDRAAAARLLGSVDVFGRLHPGVSLTSAQAAVATIDARLRRSMPRSMRNWQLDLQPMRRWHEDTRPALLVLLVAVGLIVLVACLNLAGLLFARLAGRRRELAVRAAVGASGGRLVRQLLTETLLVAMAGAAVGAALAVWAVRVIHGSVPATLASFEPGWSRMHVNARAIAFAGMAALITGFLVGMWPAFRFSRVDLLTDLKDSARTAHGSVGGGRI